MEEQVYVCLQKSLFLPLLLSHSDEQKEHENTDSPEHQSHGEREGRL